MNNKYNVIGLMSGTSLDGVDIAYCEFSYEKRWSFNLIKYETVSYDDVWKKNLGALHLKSALEISLLDCEYGILLGTLTKDFCEKYDIVPDFISSHGHTIFHQPQNGFTKQIGSGAHLSAVSGFPVICDFRSLDVALGGQGAPLVPIGDKYLFQEADYCLNLGGIANISFERKNERVAFDICACNLVLNHFAEKLGRSYDDDGKIAASGAVNVELLNKLDAITYYNKPFPKSLGREDVEKDIFPLLNKSGLDARDILSTCCEHIARQIASVTGKEKSNNRMLITGGGTLNNFLITRICAQSGCKVIIPERNIVEYKEAIIFGFLGVLRMRHEINCLKSVTGARRDSCGGVVFNPILQKNSSPAEAN